MELEILSETYNPELKRREVKIALEHAASSTPNRMDARKILASRLNAKLESIYLVKMETRTGTGRSICDVEVYDSPDVAKRVVSEYIQTRNLPPEERKKVKEEKKKEAPKPPEAKKEPSKPPGKKEEAKPEPKKEEGKPPPAKKQEVKPAETKKEEPKPVKEKPAEKAKESKK